MDIVLASQSPRRRELLGQMGIQHFRITAPDVDESMDERTHPAHMVEQLSRRKAEAAAAREVPGALIIAADTVVALGDRVLGKPKDREDAFAMLSALSGQTHRVYTGVTVIRGEQVVCQHEQTEVTFRTLTEEEIRNYIRTGEPMDKAGSYGIQGLGALMVSGIRGDYFNVMGLPVCRLGRILAEFGLDTMELACR